MRYLAVCYFVAEVNNDQPAWGRNNCSLFRLIGILLPLLMVQPLIEGILRGKQRFKTIGIMQIISSLSFLILIILEYIYMKCQVLLLAC